MKAPELPKGYIWRITEDGVEIWKKLKDKTVFESRTMLPGEWLEETEDYQALRIVRRVHSSTGASHAVRSPGPEVTVVYTNRRKRVYVHDCEWPREAGIYEVMEQAKRDWEHISKIPFGFLE